MYEYESKVSGIIVVETNLMCSRSYMCQTPISGEMVLNPTIHKTQELWNAYLGKTRVCWLRSYVHVFLSAELLFDHIKTMHFLKYGWLILKRSQTYGNGVLLWTAVWAQYVERHREGHKFVVGDRPIRRASRNVVSDSPSEVAARRKTRTDVDWLEETDSEVFAKTFDSCLDE